MEYQQRFEVVTAAQRLLYAEHSASTERAHQTQAALTEEVETLRAQVANAPTVSALHTADCLP
jgi:hypothetical protein